MEGKPWLAIVLGFLITEVVMIACAFAWVFVYSVLISPGGDEAFYQAFAKTASPIVAVVVAFPVFYAMGRFMRRYGEQARFAAVAVVGINLAIDFAAVGTMAVDVPYNVMMSFLSAVLKVAGAWFGVGRIGEIRSGTA
jgi:hypothetical protein